MGRHYLRRVASSLISFLTSAAMRGSYAKTRQLIIPLPADRRAQCGRCRTPCATTSELFEPKIFLLHCINRGSPFAGGRAGGGEGSWSRLPNRTPQPLTRDQSRRDKYIHGMLIRSLESESLSESLNGRLRKAGAAVRIADLNSLWVCRALVEMRRSIWGRVSFRVSECVCLQSANAVTPYVASNSDRSLGNRSPRRLC